METLNTLLNLRGDWTLPEGHSLCVPNMVTACAFLFPIPSSTSALWTHLTLTFQKPGCSLKLHARMGVWEVRLGWAGGQASKNNESTSWNNSPTTLPAMSLSKLWEIVKNREAWHAAVHQVAESQFSSVAHSRPALCDPMECSTPGFPVHHQLPKLTQTHVHRVSDAIIKSQTWLSHWTIERRGNEAPFETYSHQLPSPLLQRFPPF